MTTPAAAAAAPAAATPATPAAPAAPATPAAPASLIDSAPAAPAAPAAAAATPATPAAAETEWFYANGVKGTGAPPDWYKAAKYKTIEEQAKAYPELESRFGAFTGAPKDGKYDFKMPEGINGSFDFEDPLFKGFNEWAVKSQLSQDGYQQVLGLYAEALAAQAPDLASMKAQLGEKADERIGAVTAWSKANLTPEQHEKLRNATAGHDAVAVIELLEAVIDKTRQPAMPKPGADTPAGAVLAPAQLIRAEMEKKGANGRVLYFDPSPEGQAHRQKVDKMRTDAFAAGTMTL